MKKVKMNGKLSLNKETVARLNDDQMNNVKGGAVETTYSMCNVSATFKCNTNWTCPVNDVPSFV